MRQFIRHPTDVPIEYSLSDVVNSESNYLHDISHGGLCFSAKKPMRVGSRIHIGIPIDKPTFEADGTVVWCRLAEGHYDVGVEFETPADEFSVRMVEQVCQIEHYRNEVHHHQGRSLTSEQAATEWISQNAASFPR